jgi:hypothetical protein
MKSIYIKFSLFFASLLVIASCEPEFEQSVENDQIYESGEANFSNYVAVGNSLTAGFMDNALYREGQMNSFPNIMAGQFEFAGGGEFTQPMVNDNLGGLLLNGEKISPNRFVLAVGEDGNPAPAELAGTPTTEITNKLNGSFNNMGVPGARSFDLTFNGYGNPANLPSAANPYYARFASSPDASVIEDAVAQGPSFFSLWIGNNDVLGYATSGGAGQDQTGNLDPSTYGPNDITDPNVFAQVYSSLVDGLNQSASGGILMNVPDVTSIAYFSIIPAKTVTLDAETASQLNAQFSLYNTQVLGGLAQVGVISESEAQARQINFSAGNNFVTMQDENLTDISTILQGPPFSLDPQTAQILSQLRQANDSDLIPFSAAQVIGTTVNDDPTLINGVSVPLSDQYVLTPEEQSLVQAATNAYNATIEGIAQQNNLALLDVNSILTQVNQEGIPFNGGVITGEYVAGGGFSLDGVHLTPRGNALIANEAIKAINEQYNASIPMVNLGDFKTITPSNDVAQ